MALPGGTSAVSGTQGRPYQPWKSYFVCILLINICKTHKKILKRYYTHPYFMLIKSMYIHVCA